MTVGVSLKCRDSVVLACDSQATAGNYKDQATKLERLDGYHGLIMAGSGALCKDISERVKGYLRSEDNPTTRKIADITSEVMAGLYRGYAGKFGGSTMEDVLRLANGMPSQLVIGGRDENDGPIIYEVSSPGIISPVENYQPIGSGGFYASVILKKEFVKDMHTECGQFLATRAVVLASEMDPFVGEGFRMATIYRPPNGYREIEGYIKKFQEMVKTAEVLRRNLDTILLYEEEGREEALARLMDFLGAFGMGREELNKLSGIASKLRE